MPALQTSMLLQQSAKIFLVDHLIGIMGSPLPRSSVISILSLNSAVLLRGLDALTTEDSVLACLKGVTHLPIKYVFLLTKWGNGMHANS